MTRTKTAHRISLHDALCDTADCKAVAAVVFVYELDDGSNWHSMSCAEHDKVLPAGTKVTDGEPDESEAPPKPNRVRLVVDVDMDDQADWGVGVVPGSGDEMPPDNVISTVLTFVAREYHRLFTQADDPEDSSDDGESN